MNKESKEAEARIRAKLAARGFTGQKVELDPIEPNHIRRLARNLAEDSEWYAELGHVTDEQRPLIQDAIALLRRAADMEEGR
jgi:hypothetical protein